MKAGACLHSSGCLAFTQHVAGLIALNPLAKGVAVRSMRGAVKVNGTGLRHPFEAKRFARTLTGVQLNSLSSSSRQFAIGLRSFAVTRRAVRRRCTPPEQSNNEAPIPGSAPVLVRPELNKNRVALLDPDSTQQNSSTRNSIFGCEAHCRITTPTFSLGRSFLCTTFFLRPPAVTTSRRMFVVGAKQRLIESEDSATVIGLLHGFDGCDWLIRRCIRRRHRRTRWRLGHRGINVSHIRSRYELDTRLDGLRQ